MNAASGILAIHQARTGSNRLPGKVLKPILGEPMIAHQIKRVLRAGMIERLVVATSDDGVDDPLEELCGDLGVGCFRGSLEDVLDRFAKAAAQFPAAHIMRLTADCPLADAALLDELAGFYLTGGFDYASNTINRTYPKGLDGEIFSLAALQEAARNARDLHEREHVTPYFHNNADRFSRGNLAGERDYSALRWTVDWPEDLELVRAVYEALHAENPDFGMADILALLAARPELSAINAKHPT